MKRTKILRPGFSPIRSLSDRGRCGCTDHTGCTSLTQPPLQNIGVGESLLESKREGESLAETAEPVLIRQVEKSKERSS